MAGGQDQMNVIKPYFTGIIIIMIIIIIIIFITIIPQVETFEFKIWAENFWMWYP